MATFLSKVNPNALWDMIFNRGSVMWASIKPKDHPAFHLHVHSGCQVQTLQSLDSGRTGTIILDDPTTHQLTNGTGSPG